MFAVLGQTGVGADAAQQPPGLGVARRPLAGRLRRLQRVMHLALLVQLARLLKHVHGRRTLSHVNLRFFRPVPRLSLAAPEHAAEVAGVLLAAWEPHRAQVGEALWEE